MILSRAVGGPAPGRGRKPVLSGISGGNSAVAVTSNDKVVCSKEGWRSHEIVPARLRSVGDGSWNGSCKILGHLAIRASGKLSALALATDSASRPLPPSIHASCPPITERPAGDTALARMVSGTSDKSKCTFVTLCSATAMLFWIIHTVTRPLYQRGGRHAPKDECACHLPAANPGPNALSVPSSYIEKK